MLLPSATTEKAAETGMNRTFYAEKAAETGISRTFYANVRLPPGPGPGAVTAGAGLDTCAQEKEKDSYNRAFLQCFFLHRAAQLLQDNECR